jgi:hypothetical protein
MECGFPHKYVFHGKDRVGKKFLAFLVNRSKSKRLISLSASKKGGVMWSPGECFGEAISVNLLGGIVHKLLKFASAQFMLENAWILSHTCNHDVAAAIYHAGLAVAFLW